MASECYVINAWFKIWCNNAFKISRLLITGPKPKAQREGADQTFAEPNQGALNALGRCQQP